MCLIVTKYRVGKFIIIIRISGNVHMRLYLSDSYRLIVTNVIENAKLLRGLEGPDKNPDSGLLFKIIIVRTIVAKYRLYMFIDIIRISGNVHMRLYLSDSYRLIVTNVIENAKLLLLHSVL